MVTAAGAVGRRSARPGLSLLVALLALVAVSLAALFFGRYPRPGFMSLGEALADPVAGNVLFLMRAPRVLGALLVGATLGAAGCAFQLVFANPLVDAGFLGVSQGASLGAALAIVAGGGALTLFGSAFLFALGALALTTFMASRIRFGGAVLRLVLSGMAVSAFLSAAVSLVKYTADPAKKLPEISYWLMGGLGSATWSGLMLAAPAALLAVGFLVMTRWRTALLSLEESTAYSLGARPVFERGLTLGVAAAGVAAVTAFAGPVAWVGLIVPHASRIAMGTDGSATIPGSALVGAIFVVFSDAVARGLFAGELPLGIVTAMLGTAAFFALLLGRRVRVERA